jgi:hypothetical protein
MYHDKVFLEGNRRELEKTQRCEYLKLKLIVPFSNRFYWCCRIANEMGFRSRCPTSRSVLRDYCLAVNNEGFKMCPIWNQAQQQEK